MNFGFTEEQELLRKTARGLLATHAPMTRVREVMAERDAWDPLLWRRMAELGWMGLSVPEAHGGAGLSLIELCIVIEELGRSLAPVPFLPSAMASSAIAALGDAAQRDAWLPRFASGELRGSLAITEAPGDDAPAAHELEARAVEGGYAIHGRKLFVPEAARADLLVVLVGSAGGGSGRFFLVPRDAAGVSIDAMSSLDLLRPLYAVGFESVRVPTDALLGRDAHPGERVEEVLDAARVMICAEMVGAAERCLEDSVAHARSRVQFDRPIGANQAIKHKCADMLLQLESARQVTYYAAWAAAGRGVEAALSAAVAKAYTSDAFSRISGENIQIHGGVGFTWEYDCHLFYKRAKGDAAWLGDGARHRERVARMLSV